MKRILSFVFALILFSGLLVLHAETNQYRIDELRLSITMPEEYYVFTRGMDASDPLLQEFEMTPDEVDESLDQDYLLALSNDGMVMIGILAVEAQTGETPFENQTDEELLRSIKESDSEMALWGIQGDGMGVLRTEDAVFTWERIRFGTSYDSVAIIQYMTLKDGMYILIQARTYAIFCNDELLEMMHEIVKSAKFEDGEVSTFVDPYTGLSFTPPSGFREVASTGIPGALTEKIYISMDSAGNKAIALYCSMDLYSQLPESQKALYGYERARFNSHDWSLAAFKLMVGNGMPYEFSEVYYGGKKYIRYNDSEDGEVSPQFFIIDNGYLYMFQYSFTEEHELFSAFSDLLESVQY